jgi:hypothetical protein
MGILDFLTSSTYAAQVERAVAKRLGILPIQITKRQKNTIIEAATTGKAMGWNADKTAEMCLESVKAMGVLDNLK